MKRTTYKDICCHAAALYASQLDADVADISKWHLHRVFPEYFYPGNMHLYDLWFGDPTIKENQMARSLALLFLAKFIEEET